jgi:putative flippase GtrA
MGAPRVSAGYAGLLGQFVRFAGVGAIGTGAHYLTLFALMAVATHPTAATSAGAVIGALVNYALNYRYTFHSRQRHRDTLWRFLALAIIGLMLNGGIMHGLLALAARAGIVADPAHAPIWIVLVIQIIATGAVLLWNFAGNRWWTFAEDHK